MGCCGIRSMEGEGKEETSTNSFAGACDLRHKVFDHGNGQSDYSTYKKVISHLFVEDWKIF